MIAKQLSLMQTNIIALFDSAQAFNWLQNLFILANSSKAIKMFMRFDYYCVQLCDKNNIKDIAKTTSQTHVTPNLIQYLK